MNCPNCGQEVLADGSFCGNCGQALLTITQPAQPLAVPTIPGNASPNLDVPVSPAPTDHQAVPVALAASQIAQVYASQVAPPSIYPAVPAASFTPVANPDSMADVPNYAQAPVQTHGHTKPVLAIVFGVLGVGGALIPLIGIAFSIAGIVLSTLTPKSAGRGLKNTGLILAIIGLVVSLAAFVFAAVHNPHLRAGSSFAAKGSVSLSTPCYGVHFASRLTIDNQSGSCTMTAYDGTTATNSTTIYKILSSKATAVNTTNLTAVAKPAIEQDVASSLPDFKITTEHATQFAGSPAYIVTLYNQNKDVAAIEAAIFHPTKQGSNFFVIVHANIGSSIDLNNLESSWQWK